jgi:hypothetical protein
MTIPAAPGIAAVEPARTRPDAPTFWLEMGMGRIYDDAFVHEHCPMTRAGTHGVAD